MNLEDETDIEMIMERGLSMIEDDARREEIRTLLRRVDQGKLHAIVRKAIKTPAPTPAETAAIDQMLRWNETLVTQMALITRRQLSEGDDPAHIALTDHRNMQLIRPSNVAALLVAAIFMIADLMPDEESTP